MLPHDLLRELKRTVDELQALNDIGRALTSTLDLPEVLRLVMARAQDLVKASRFSLLLIDDAASELRFEVASGPGSDRLASLRLPVGEGLAGWVARERQPVLVQDAARDPRFAPQYDAATGQVTGSLIAVPLVSKGRALGVIEVVSGRGERELTPEDLATVQALADHAAIAIENAQAFERIRDLTIVDEHTGLFNTRHLKRVLEAEVVRSERYGRPFSLVFIDLDHFKDVNDRHGHQAGSAALSEVGEVLRAGLREADVPTRYGGDEYVLLLPEADREQAVAVAERLRVAIAGHTFLADRGLAVRLTASLGVATWPVDGRRADELLGRADAAMYHAKGASRDAVAHAGVLAGR
ncbi:MAG TPA: sensor domain-containing diguanylate cyclase [Anaeromyxobacteraceae bacterium]|nr:sensor domain-containing diguanylate cyclase [Anaeromyxobacteraceae bacterium]